MTHAKIPDPVRRLIIEHIPSVERLEILLLLFDGREHRWSVEEIEEHIRSTPESIRQNVSALVSGRWIAASTDPRPLFRFEGSPDATETVAQLGEVYRTSRVAVIELIYSDRQTGVRSFSEAFKLGKTP